MKEEIAFEILIESIATDVAMIQMMCPQSHRLEKEADRWNLEVKISRECRERERRR